MSRPTTGGLFDRFKPTANALQNVLRGPRKFQGTGQSLGGGQSHRTVISVQLTQPGPLGMGVEKMQSSGCIVSRVEPGSQAELAGVQRGDVVCFAGSVGEEEVDYKLFLEMAKSPQRPLCFELRRVGGGSAGTASPAPATSPSPSSDKTTTSRQSAEAYARKQAVIAAAEARERAHKAKLQPIARKKDATTTASSGSPVVNELPSDDPKSEAARAAIEEAKKKEALLAAELGYNPYETNRASAGQARQATVTVTHGALQGNGGDPPSSAFVPALNRVRPPRAAMREERAPTSPGRLPPDVEDALEVLVTSSTEHPSAAATVRKLVTNATTKGQDPDDEASAKFRRVRLSNPKIAASVVGPPGALDVMMASGFVLTEEDGESWLVYPCPAEPPVWLPEVLRRLQACEP